jgi:hypothetical protein
VALPQGLDEGTDEAFNEAPDGSGGGTCLLSG